MATKPEKNEAGQPVLHLGAEQIATGGIRNVESHYLDWTIRESSDLIAGVLAGRSRFIYGKKDESGKVQFDFEVQSNVKGDEKANELIRKFLHGEVLADGSPCEGWLAEKADIEGLGERDAVLMQNFTESRRDGWTSEQVCLPCCLFACTFTPSVGSLTDYTRFGGLKCSTASVSCAAVQ